MTWLSDQLPGGQPVLDPSVIINLLGTHQPVEVLHALGHSCLIEERTLNEVTGHPVPELRVEPVLDHLKTSGLLEIVRMTDDEYEVYLSFVMAPLGTRLGAGESAALAIAARGCCIVRDDRKARNIAARNQPDRVVVSSLRLFMASACRAGWPPARVRELVEQTRSSARMGVPRDELALPAEALSA